MNVLVQRGLERGEAVPERTPRDAGLFRHLVVVRQLAELAERGAGLYHRLAVFPINVPPLRDRIEDIPMLAGYFCDAARRRLGVGPVRITPAPSGCTAAISITSPRGWG